MNSFLWVMGVMLVASVFGKLAWLSSSEREPRRPGVVAFDACIEMLMLVWLATLIAGRAA